MSLVWVECWKCDECGHRWIKTPLHPERCPSRACRKRSWNKDQAFVPADPTSAADVAAASEASRIARYLPRVNPDMDLLRQICAGTVAPELTDEGRAAASQIAPAEINVVELAKWHAERFGAAEEMDRLASMPYREEIAICGKTWWEDGEHWECLMDAGHKESKHGMRGMVRKLGD